jgi:thiosulfate dehydrogenase [quinone] large subunit
MAPAIKFYSMRDAKIPFFFLRLPIAISFLGHGLVRIPKLVIFTEGLVKTMEKSIIPVGMIVPFGYALPLLEAITGLALLVGYKTNYAIYAGLAILSLLILGSSSVENWSAIEAQLIHAIYLLGLFIFWHRYMPQEQNSV